MLRSTSSALEDGVVLVELLFPFPFPLPWEEVSDELCLGGRGREVEDLWVDVVGSSSSMSGGSCWLSDGTAATSSSSSSSLSFSVQAGTWRPVTVQRTEKKKFSHTFIFYFLQIDQQQRM